MIVDANILLYAVDARSPVHETASAWLTEALNGDRRVGLPWQTLGAFLRISTHPRVVEHPLTPTEASDYLTAWLSAGPAWVPPATERTASILGELVVRHRLTGNLIPDAQLTALAIEHGLEVYSADGDFARFPEIRWVNPLT